MHTNISRSTKIQIQNRGFMRHNTHKMLDRIINNVKRLGRVIMFTKNGKPVCAFGHIAVALHGKSASNYTARDIGRELKIDPESIWNANDHGEDKNVKRPVLRALRNMCQTCAK